MENQNIDELQTAMAELEAKSLAFVRKRNIDGIALLKKRIEHQISPNEPTTATFPLKIKCCGGRGFPTTLNIKPSDTIKDVKFELWDKHGIPPCQQRLIYKELQLEEDRRLNDYNIQNGTDLHMVVHLLGYNTHSAQQFDFKLSYQQLGQLYLDLDELSKITFESQPNVSGIEELKQRIESEISAIRTKIELLNDSTQSMTPIVNEKRKCCGGVKRVD